MATDKQENLRLYKVLSPVKSGGKRYGVDEVVPLNDEDAKRLAADCVVEAKPIKAKAEKPPEGDDKKLEGGEQTQTEE